MTKEEAITILSWMPENFNMLGSGCVGEREAIKMAIEALSADAVDGEWVFVHNESEIFAGEYFCSICGKRAEVDLYGEWILSNYCPSCGAYLGERREE